MPDEQAPPTIDINYIKSPSFREAACDGAMGGQTPQNKIWMGFYSERLPIPRIVRQSLLPTDDEGGFTLDQSTAAVAVDSRSGIVRNLEFGIYMTVDTAENIRDWLTRRLEEIKGGGE